MIFLNKLFFKQWENKAHLDTFKILIKKIYYISYVCMTIFIHESTDCYFFNW